MLGRQDEELLDGMDVLIISPGISIHHALPQAALRRKIPVWGEVELAGRLCQAPMVAVTGTNGKTTTTTLLGEMIKTRFDEVVVGVFWLCGLLCGLLGLSVVLSSTVGGLR